MIRKNILICLIHDLSNRNKRFNLGPGIISAALKQSSYNVKNFVWDLSCHPDVNEINLTNTISHNDIDVVMVGGNLYIRVELDHIFKVAKKVSSSIITIQGGHFATNSPLEAMALLPQCDIGVIGEGDITICELMSAIENKTKLNEVKGIIFKENNTTIITEKRLILPDMSLLPIPDHESFFGDWLNGFERYSILSGRSCNMECTFCASRVEKKHRERPFEKIFEELDYYMSKFDIRKIYFSNELFNCEKSYIDAFCEKMSSYNIPYHIETRLTTNLSRETINKMKDSGLTGIYLGLESADNSVLRSMKKGTTAELMLEVLQNIKDAQIDANGSFIFGDTAETSQTVRRTFNFVHNHRDLLQGLDMGVVILSPGAPIYEKAILDGKIEALSHIENYCPPVNFSKLTDDEYNFINNYYFDYFFNNKFQIDLNIQNVTFDRADGSVFDFKFECATCGNTNNLKADIIKTNPRGKAFTFFCDCGERLRLDPYTHLINKDKISQMIKNHKTAFYGTGWVFQKISYKCKLSTFTENEYHLLDILEQEEFLYDNPDRSLVKKAFPIESITELDIEKVIVTIGTRFDPVATLTDLKQKYSNTEFVLWYELSDC
jgi:radical SAM superfamily enzyme YgiQ (UPF0313 family)